MPTQDTAAPYWLQGSAAAQTLARILLARYPAAFHAEAAAVRPLKIGIDHDIRQALEVAPRVVSEVLRGYTRRRAYRTALAVPGALRVDLHGQPVAPVTPEHQQWAQQGSRRPASQTGAAPAAAPGPASAATPAATPRTPIRDFTPYLPQGDKPMAVNATLKFVLREVPDSREHEGMVYLALQNVPKGVPARVQLAEAPLSVACTSKMWRTALQRTQAHAANGRPPLWIVEAHVGVHDGALLAVVKGIQVVAGQPAADAGS
jgi:sRNA-binding protein